MSILDKIISNKNNEVIDPNKLNKQELELLLIVLKNATIK